MAVVALELDNRATPPNLRKEIGTTGNGQIVYQISGGCDGSSYCPQADASLKQMIDIYVREYNPNNITPEKIEVYKEMINREEAVVDQKTGHAKLDGDKWVRLLDS